MNASTSLRARLVVVILTPLMAIAVAAGLWQLANARSTASEVQERRLLLTALAISNDVISSGGDVLAPATEA
ncbi:MAG: sensor histidine kinase, partial [Pseudomonadota bacterium]